MLFDMLYGSLVFGFVRLCQLIMDEPFLTSDRFYWARLGLYR